MLGPLVPGSLSYRSDMYRLQTLKSHLECIKYQSEVEKYLTEPVRLRKKNTNSLRGGGRV